MPTIPKKRVYSRLALGAGAILLGALVLYLQFFVFNRVYVLLSLGCGAAILAGMTSPLLLKDWACASCGSGLSYHTFRIPPEARGAFEQALAGRDVPKLTALLDAQTPAPSGESISYEECEKCGQSLLTSTDSTKDVPFVAREAEALGASMKRLLVGASG